MMGSLDSPVLRSMPASGTVVIELIVRKDGTVSNLRVISFDLPGNYLAHVMKTFREARYQAGEVAGSPVDAAIRVEVSYQDRRAALVSRPDVPAPVPVGSNTVDPAGSRSSSAGAPSR